MRAHGAPAGTGARGRTSRDYRLGRGPARALYRAPPEDVSGRNLRLSRLLWLHGDVTVRGTVYCAACREFGAREHLELHPRGLNLRLYRRGLAVLERLARVGRVVPSARQNVVAESLQPRNYA